MIDPQKFSRKPFSGDVGHVLGRNLYGIDIERLPGELLGIDHSVLVSVDSCIWSNLIRTEHYEP